MSETKSLALMPLADIREMAAVAAKSGLFPDIKTTEAALGLMLLCQAEGLHPVQALRRYHIIQGRPAMKADAMLAEFQSRGGKVQWVENTDQVCTAEFFAPAVNGPTKVSWTLKDAERAGVTSNPTWRKYPRQMLRARVISEAIRMTMPEVVVGIYSPEEVESFTPANDARAEYIPPAPAPDEDVGGLDPTDTHPTVGVVKGVFPGAKALDLVPCWRRLTDGVKKAGTLRVDWVAMDPQPRRSEAQSARLHSLKRERGLDDGEWRSRLLAKFNKETSRDLADFEASQVIEALEASTARHGTADQKATKKLERAIRGQADLAEAAGVDLAVEQAAQPREPGEEG